MALLYPQKLLRRLRAALTPNVIESVAGGSAAPLGELVGGSAPEVALGTAVVVHGVHKELEERAARWGRGLPSRPRHEDEYVELPKDPERIGAVLGDIGAIQLGPLLQQSMTTQTGEVHAVIDTAALNGSSSASLWPQVRDLSQYLDALFPGRRLDWVVVATGITDVVTHARFEDDGLKKLVGMSSAGERAYPPFRGAVIGDVLIPDVHVANGVPKRFRPVLKPKVTEYREQQLQAIMEFLPPDQDAEQAREAGSFMVGESDVVVFDANELLAGLAEPEPATMRVDLESRLGMTYSPVGLAALAKELTARLGPLVTNRPPNHRTGAESSPLILPTDLTTEEFRRLGRLDETDVAKLGQALVGEPGIAYPLDGRAWLQGSTLVVPSSMGSGPTDPRRRLPAQPDRTTRRRNGPR